MAKGSQFTFNGGEFSEFMDARVDTERFPKGCRRLENFTLLPYGAALSRPGTVFGGEAKFSSRDCRVIPFRFSTNVFFDIEVGHLYFRFWNNQARQLNAGGGILEVVSPYLEEHLFELQFEQLNDLLYIVHPLYAPRRLTRVANNNWTLAIVDFYNDQAYPPLMPRNTDPSVKLLVIGTATNVGASLQLNGIGFNWQAGDVGVLMMVGNLATSTEQKNRVLVTAVDMVFLPVYVLGDWVFQTQGIGVYTVRLEQSTDKVTWTVRRSYNVDASNNVLLSGSEDEPVFFRVKITVCTSANTTTIPYVVIETAAALVPGLVRITAVNLTTNSATGTVVEPFGEVSLSGFLTDVWALPYFSARNGWPRAVCFHRNRLILASNDVWCSEAGNYENFRTGNDAEKGFMVPVRANGAPVVNWLESLRELRVGCDSAEAVITQENDSEAFGYNNYLLRWDSNYGSKYIRATPVNGTLFFIQGQGLTGRYQVVTGIEDFYDANSITVFADHILGDGVTQTAYQRQRFPTFHAVLKNGTIASHMFDQSQNIQAWYRSTTQGQFKSISVTMRPDEEDTVCVVVKRVVGGVDKRYIEFFARNQYRTLQNNLRGDMVFVDSAKVVMGTAMTSVTGLSHLEGMTVAVLADGLERADQVVTGGTITLSPPANKVAVGLPYEYFLTPMFLESSGIMGRAKSIGAAIVRLWRSGRAWAKVDGGRWSKLNPAAAELKTGDSEKITLSSDWDRNTGIEIKGRSPLPLNVQAITLEFDVGKG